MAETLRVIPCLDVKNGQVVKGVNFEGLRIVGNPIELAKKYYEQGADELCFLDVTATIEGRGALLDVVTSVAETVFIPLTVGGGINSVSDVQQLLNAGADKVSVGSAAITRPNLLSEISNRFGSQILVVSLDCKRSTETKSGYELTTHGGSKDTGMDLLTWLSKASHLGVGEILINSIDADGTKQGFDLEMTKTVLANCPMPVIASGGAGKLEHFSEVSETGADAVLAASVFHLDELTISQVKHQLNEKGVTVR